MLIKEKGGEKSTMRATKREMHQPVDAFKYARKENEEISPLVRSPEGRIYVLLLALPKGVIYYI